MNHSESDNESSIYDSDSDSDFGLPNGVNYEELENRDLNEMNEAFDIIKDLENAEYDSEDDDDDTPAENLAIDPVELSNNVSLAVLKNTLIGFLQDIIYFLKANFIHRDSNMDGEIWDTYDEFRQLLAEYQLIESRRRFVNSVDSIKFVNYAIKYNTSMSFRYTKERIQDLKTEFDDMCPSS